MRFSELCWQDFFFFFFLFHKNPDTALEPLLCPPGCPQGAHTTPNLGPCCQVSNLFASWRVGRGRGTCEQQPPVMASPGIPGAAPEAVPAPFPVGSGPQGKGKKDPVSEGTAARSCSSALSLLALASEWETSP